MDRDQLPPAGALKQQRRALPVKLEIGDRVKQHRLVAAEPVYAGIEHQFRRGFPADGIDRFLQGGSVVRRIGRYAELLCVENFLLSFFRRVHLELPGAGGELFRQGGRFRLRLRRNRFELRRGDRDFVHQRVHLEMGMELQRVVVRRFGNIQPEGHELLLADVFQRDHSGVGEAVAGGERPGYHQQVRGCILLLFQHLDPECNPVAFPGFQDFLRQAPRRVPLAAALPGVDLQRAGAGERSCGIELRITAVVPSAAEVLLKVEHRSGGGDAQRQRGCRDKLNFHADSPCSTTG